MVILAVTLRYLSKAPKKDLLSSLSISKNTVFQSFRATTMATRVQFKSDAAFSGYQNKLHSKCPSKVTVPTDPVNLAKTVFFEGVKSVIPSRLIPSRVQLQGSLLRLDDEEGTTIDLSQFNKKYVVGFGKACLPMAESLLELLNGLVDRCIVSVPVGSRACMNSSVEVYQGAKNNIPDEDSFKAANKILNLVRSCTPQDLLIVLISGGGSALLPYPIPPITLDEKQNLIKSLSRAGCTITEMNTVRKRLSLVKGGGLVQMCNAQKIVSLIISDVAGSPLDIIASGPTVQDLDLADAALNIIGKYNLGAAVTPNIRTVLSREPVVQNQEQFKKVTNFIVGDNKLALEAAANTATKCGLHPFIITTTMSGEAADVGYNLGTLAESFARCAKFGSSDERNVKVNVETILRIFKSHGFSTEGVIPEILEQSSSNSKGVCMLFGGETTVTVRGTGSGGRNQEMALSAGIRLDICRNLPHVKDKIAVLCAGTDGFDGPNEAAGAVVEGSTIHGAQIQGISPLQHLKNNDSFNFFRTIEDGKYHIVCGHTETNVMDIAIIVILKKAGEAANDINRTKSML